MRMTLGDHGIGKRIGCRACRWAPLLLLLLLVACDRKDGKGPPQSQAGDAYGINKNSGKLEVGMITVGPVSDWGYNYQHNQGRLGLEARLRNKVHTVIVENVPETADVERVMQRMSDAGAGLIFATSYGYADSTLRVAAKTPNVKFMQCLGSKQAQNVGTYSIRVWEPAYVCGVVAASTLEGETRFGFLAAHPVPPINWTVNAFCLGAQSVNPSVTVDIVYTNSWNDPAAEAEAAKSLAAKGVKAIYVLTDSPIAGVQAAEQAGVYSLAHFADVSSFAPRKWLTGTIWKWSALYVDVAQQVLDGKWEGKHYAGGFKEGYVDIAPFGPDVKSPAQEKARQVIAEIASGSRDVFAGPVHDAQGKLRIPEGKAASIGEILSLDWVVKGVRGAPAPKN
jgi:basic membrane protein A and related proteins